VTETLFFNGTLKTNYLGIGGGILMAFFYLTPLWGSNSSVYPLKISEI